jgi:aspartate-semialdehyde dehydrogenase
LASRHARIALVGATGTVGSQIAELLAERNFPYSELKLFARESSGRMVDTGERSLPVDRLNHAQDLSAFDVAFLAIPSGAASEIIQAQPGPILIDLSAATLVPRAAVAMIAPGASTREQIAQASPDHVFRVPHPVSHLIATILHALSHSGFAAASIMLSASAAGHQAVSEMFQQSADLLNARLDLDDEPQVAFNVFCPQSSLELAHAFSAQIRLLRNDCGQLLLNIVRVPAFHGTGVALFLPRGESQTSWPERLRSAPGLLLVNPGDAAGFVDAVGQDGAITRITLDEAGASVWCAFDAARLAALTAVWIAETLL